MEFFFFYPESKSIPGFSSSSTVKILWSLDSVLHERVLLPSTVLVWLSVSFVVRRRGPIIDYSLVLLSV